MALIRCPECRSKISQHAITCPHCGLPYREIPNPAKNMFKVWLTRIAAGLIAVAVIVFSIWGWRATRPQPAIPRLNDTERMIFDALCIGAAKTFADPQSVEVVDVGGLTLVEDPTADYPAGQYHVTLKLRYTDDTGATITANYRLALQDYSKKTFLSLADRNYKKGDMEKTSLPIMNYTGGIDVKLLNAALVEYYVDPLAAAQTGSKP